MTMDADLQDDPHEIPRFLNHMDVGFDVVSGWKQVRHDPWHKVLPSRVFNWMVSAMTGVHLHDHNCGMKCYRREIFDEVRLYGELHRFVPVLAYAPRLQSQRAGREPSPTPLRQIEVWRAADREGFSDLLTVKFLTGFGQRPQHLLGTLGLVCFLLGGLGAGILDRVLGGRPAVSRVGLAPLAPATGHAVFAWCAVAWWSVDVDWLSGRVDHRLSRPRHRHVFRGRGNASPRGFEREEPA